MTTTKNTVFTPAQRPFHLTFRGSRVVPDPAVLTLTALLRASPSNPVAVVDYVPVFCDAMGAEGKRRNCIVMIL